MSGCFGEGPEDRWKESRSHLPDDNSFASGRGEAVIELDGDEYLVGIYVQIESEKVSIEITSVAKVINDEYVDIDASVELKSKLESKLTNAQIFSVLE